MNAKVVQEIEKGAAGEDGYEGEEGGGGPRSDVGATAVLWRGTTGPIDTAAGGGCHDRASGIARGKRRVRGGGRGTRGHDGREDGRWGCGSGGSTMVREREENKSEGTGQRWRRMGCRGGGSRRATPRRPPTPLPSRMAPRSPTSSSCSVAAVGLSECATDTLRRIGLRRSVVPQCYRACRFTPCPHCCWFCRAGKKEGKERRVGGRGCSAWDTLVKGEDALSVSSEENCTASSTFPSWRAVGATFWTNCPSVITLNRVNVSTRQVPRLCERPLFLALLRSASRKAEDSYVVRDTIINFLDIKIYIISRWSRRDK